MSKFSAELCSAIATNKRLVYVTTRADIIIENWMPEFTPSLFVTMSAENRVKVVHFFAGAPKDEGKPILNVLETQVPEDGDIPDVLVISISQVENRGIPWTSFKRVVVCGMDNVAVVEPKIGGETGLVVLAQEASASEEGYEIIFDKHDEVDYRVHCLGSAGFYATETMHTMCWMIPKLGVVFDGGSGFFRCANLSVTDTIDVFISHAHLDHIDGLRMASRLGVSLRLHAEEHVIKALDMLWTEPFCHEGVCNPFFVCPITDLSPIHLANGAVIQPFKTCHTSPSLGFRLDFQEHSISYVTDTTSSSSSEYVDIVSGTKLLIHECWLPASKSHLAENGGHSSAAHVISFANAVNPRQVVLAHLNPTGDLGAILSEVRCGFPVTVLAEERKSYIF